MSAQKSQLHNLLCVRRKKRRSRRCERFCGGVEVVDKILHSCTCTLFEGEVLHRDTIVGWGPHDWGQWVSGAAAQTIWWWNQSGGGISGCPLFPLRPSEWSVTLQVRHCRRRGFVDLFQKVLSLSPITLWRISNSECLHYLTHKLLNSIVVCALNRFEQPSLDQHTPSAWRGTGKSCCV